MADLPKHTLGRTGLDVTVLGFGAMEVRGPSGRAPTPDQAKQGLNAVIDSGINYIDTSFDYGDSEDLIGEYISNRRNEYVLASKCGCQRTAYGYRDHIFTRKNILDGVNQTLKRLRTDHLDVIQFHMSPSKEVIEREQAVQTLLDLKREGKVRFIGSSSTLPNLVDHIRMGVFDVLQIPYSALDRRHEALIGEAAKAGAGTVIRGGAGKGAPGEGQGSQDTWNLWDKAKLNDLLDGGSKTEFMIRFTITHPDLSTTIVGPSNLEHLKANVLAVKKGPLPASVYEEAKRRLAAAGSIPARAVWLPGKEVQPCGVNGTSPY